jgi:glycosyltransferase involved in cell wall biosynthesis
MAKSKKKILIIGSYPIVQPLHGGQKRAHAVVTEYRKHFGDVKYVAVFSRWANPVAARTDIPVSHHTDWVIKESNKVEDIITGEAIFKEAGVKARFAQLLRSFHPDIIQLEQVYSYLGLKPLLEELNLQPQLVFDAHNVESDMKRAMYESAGLDHDTTEQLVGRIADLERELAGRSVLTVAVSPADQEHFNSAGAHKTVLARNGIYPSPAAPGQVADWKKQFASEGIARTFLYVASAHMPNWTSFQEVIGEGLGFLRPDARILIAGGLSDYLTTRHVWPATPGAATFWCRAKGCGILTEDHLGALIAASDTIILPIASGGGSNLKTAEALLSGKPIVATSYAFRAYEKFMNYPTVTIADTPAGFREAILRSMSAAPAALTAGQRAEVAEVTWPYTLRDLIQEVAAL